MPHTGRGGTGSLAARAAQHEMIDEFLSRGIDPRLEDEKGKTVLDCAKTAWVRELLSAR